MPRSGVRCVAATLLIALSPSAHTVELVSDPGALTPVQAERAEGVVADVIASLPSRWRQALGTRVEIEWRDDLPAEVHGRALRGRVLLRRSLLDVAPPTQGMDPVAAALVHELAHVLDRGDAGGLSRDPRILDLAGWQATPLRGRTIRSAFRDRSPDRYELHSPTEFLAVNLERFVLDPQYPCRRPALARQLASHVGAPPRRVDCASGHAFVQSDATPHADPSPLLELEPSRVAGVEVLLAEPGGPVMSRWGHVMLRLVVCAPQRAVGPDCRFDIPHHRVLSFRAFVDDVQVSSWRGLTGSYPSRLFVLPLSQVVDEYTKVELRGLRSVPLKLDREGIDALLEHAAQVHWSYDGRYYFVSNNCAVETWRLLRDGVPGLDADRLASITPTGLMARLERAGIADASVLDDREAAISTGHYFPSQSSHYSDLFDALRREMPLPVRDVQAWLAQPAIRRAPWIARADIRASAAMLVLEDAALRREEARARADLKRSIARGALAGRDATAREALRVADRLSRPAALLDEGYGLPQAAERTVLRARAAGLAETWHLATTGLRDEARRWLSPQRRSELEASEANVAALGARLRELHRASGGVDLDARER